MNPKPDPTPCACGCGRLATPGRKFISGHNNRGRKGELSSRFTGGRHRRVNGRVFVLAPDHPYASGGNGSGGRYVQEHRLVMEEHLRETRPDSPHLIRIGDQLYLRPEVVVHHIDGTKDNNVVSNLAAMTNAEHTRLHHSQGDIRH